MMEIVLRSNRGYECLLLDFHQRHDCGQEEGFDCSVTIHGSAWDSGEPQTVHADLGFRHLSLIELKILHEKIVTWLDLPLQKLANTPLDSKHNLDFTGVNKLSIEFGGRNDTINAGKPIVTIGWNLGSFKGDIHFVTDPSCLQSFVDGLGPIITRLERTM